MVTEILKSGLQKQFISRIYKTYKQPTKAH